MPTATRTPISDCLVHGVVVTGAGAALSGATISISKASKSVPERGIRTDEDGAFLLPLPPGRFEITARGGDLIGVAKVSIEANSTEDHVTIRASAPAD